MMQTADLLSCACFFNLLSSSSAEAHDTRFFPLEVPEDVWDSQAEEQSSNLPSMSLCAAWTVKGALTVEYSAFSFSGPSSACERGRQTCLRGGGGGPSRTVMASNWQVEYLGCYTDFAGGSKNLPVVVGTGMASLTPWACAGECRRRGEAFAGVSGGDECRCGSTQPLNQRRRSELDCAEPCAGGHGPLTCGGSSNLVQQVYRITEQATGSSRFTRLLPGEKAGMTVSGTEGMGENYSLPLLADGSSDTDYWSQERAHPWVQLDMGARQRVKGASFWCLDERYCSRLEVRVGDTDVAALGGAIPTVDHLKMCANRLCFTSGLQMGTARILQQQDCITPLLGRFLTVQKYDHVNPIGHAQLGINELEVFVYCQGDPTPGPPDFCPEEDEPTGADDCTLHEEGWNGVAMYIGCFADSGDDRLMEDYAGKLASMTPASCAEECLSTVPGTTYMGLQYRDRCYCGNSQPPADRRISEGACGMACAGDAAHKCGAGFKSSVYSIAGISPGGPFSIPAKLTDTTGWTATASHIREDGAHGSFPSHAIDGNEASTRRWATPVALQEPYPWLQIDLGVTLTVFEVEMLGWNHNCCRERHTFIEVRVGDTAAGSVTGIGKRICANRVCHTTGPSEVWGAKFPCTVPLPGRYLTFQRTRATSSAHTGVWSWQTNINELYVTAV